MPKKVLVTGGTGFIASHLVDRLIKTSYQVVVVDNLSTGRKENLNKKAKFYKVNICNSKISQVFKKEKPEIVFHYAAQTNVQKSMVDPVGDAKINIFGTLNILENCRKFRVKKIIFSSSIGVYGEPKTLPVKESHPLNPISPYSINKLIAEKYLNYYQSKGLSFVILRYSNVYGPRQSSSGEGGVVAIFIDRILKGRKPTIFGTGEQTRDFLYVADSVEAAILAMNAFPGSIYNIGTNKKTTINNLLKLISDILKKETRPIFSSFRQGEIVESRIDFTKAKKELNWQPKYLLKEGLRKTLNMIR